MKKMRIYPIFEDRQNSILRWHVDCRDGTPAQEVQKSQVDREDFFECTCGGSFTWSLAGSGEWCPHIRAVCLRLIAEEALEDLAREGVMRRTGRYKNALQVYQLTHESELTDHARAERKRLGLK